MGNFSMVHRFHVADPPNFNEGSAPDSRKGPTHFRWSPPFCERSDERCYLGQLEEDPAHGQRKDQCSYASLGKILSEQGHSVRSIARILRLSRRTVRKFLEPKEQPPVRTVVWWRQLIGITSVGSLWQRDYGQADPAGGGLRNRVCKVLASVSGKG